MRKYVAVLITPVYLPPITLKLALPCMFSLRWNRISLKSLLVVEVREAHMVQWVGHSLADRGFGLWFPAGMLIPSFLPPHLGFIQLSIQCVPSVLSPDLDLPEREVDHSYIYIYLVPKLVMRGTTERTPPSPTTAAKLRTAILIFTAWAWCMNAWWKVSKDVTGRQARRRE